MVGIVGAARITGSLIFSKDYAIGPIKVDTFLSENHTSSLTVSNHPVETGYVLTDHVVYNPVEIGIEGLVSDVETQFGITYGLIGVGRSVFNKLIDGKAGTRSTATWKLLRALQQNGEVFSLETSLAVYTNMVLTSLSVSRNRLTVNALPFSATLRKIQIVESQNFTGDLGKLTTKSPVTDTAKTNDSTVDRSIPKQDHGLQSVRPPTTSILKGLLN